ncbi:hypothetical protein ACB092_03G237500 [Castanea dentata]
MVCEDFILWCVRLGSSPIARIFIFLVKTFFLEFCSVEWVILLEPKTQDSSVNKQKSATTTVTQPSLAGAKKRIPSWI